jgi:hypothetical protein
VVQGPVKAGQLFTKAARAKAFVIKVTGQPPSSIAPLIWSSVSGIVMLAADK